MYNNNKLLSNPSRFIIQSHLNNSAHRDLAYYPHHSIIRLDNKVKVQIVDWSISAYTLSSCFPYLHFFFLSWHWNLFNQTTTCHDLIRSILLTYGGTYLISPSRHAEPATWRHPPPSDHEKVGPLKFLGPTASVVLYSDWLLPRSRESCRVFRRLSPPPWRIFPTTARRRKTEDQCHRR